MQSSAVSSVQAQAESVQVWSTSHWVPQAPQLLSSLVVSTQSPLQLVLSGSVSQGPWSSAQLPASHIWPVSQAVPHAPQLAMSLWRSTQSLSQLVLGAQAAPPASGGAEPPSAGVVPLHAPFLQTWPVVQALPQAPQLFLSEVVFTQLLPHWVLGAGHWPLQVPAVQVWPAVHFLEQLPQWLMSVWVSTQVPLQSVSLPWQLPAADWHEPDWQV